MLKVLYSVFRDYGMDSVQLGIICFFGWKLFTNHLKHMQDKINHIDEKIGVFETELNQSKERISKIEGKIE